MIAILKGSEIKSIENFHDAVQVALKFPDFYGKNLDALWDCLTGWILLPVTLVWQDFEMSKEKMGDFANDARLVFEDAAKEIDGFNIEFA